MNRFGEAGAGARANDDAIDNSFDGVGLASVERGNGVEVEDDAIDADADLAGFADLVEDFGVLALVAADEGGQQH